MSKRIIALSEKAALDTNDVMAVDNASGGTKKFKVQKILDQISAVATAADEAIDQVDDEVTELKSGISALENATAIIKDTLINGLNFPSPYTQFVTGAYYRVQYFPVTKGSTYDILFTSTYASSEYRMAFSTSVPSNGVTGTLVRKVTPTPDTSYSELIKYTPDDNGYIAFAFYKELGQDCTLTVTKYIDSEYKESISDINRARDYWEKFLGYPQNTEKPDIHYIIGGYISTGEIITTVRNRIASEKIPVFRGMTFSFSDDTAQYILLYYNLDGTFNNDYNYQWISGNTVIAEDAVVRIYIRKGTSNANFTEDEIPTYASYISIDFNGGKFFEDVEIPAYWHEYLTNKQSQLTAADATLGRNGVSFAFVTDVHYQTNNKKSPALIKYITRHTNVRDVVFGGDLVTWDTTKAIALKEYTWWDTNTSELNIVNLRGNHDGNQNEQSNSENVISKSEFYGLQCRQAEPYVMFADGEVYGYRDNNNQKVRFIYLDTGDYDAAVIDDTQINWMKARIQELAAGWTVIVFCHQFFTGVAKTVSTLEIDASGTKIMNALDAIYDSVSATIACVICGHCHRDYSIVSAKGYPIISTTTDSASYQSENYDPDTPNRTAGTTLEQCFDLYYINTSARTISTIRIGAGDTARNRSWTY